MVRTIDGGLGGISVANAYAKGRVMDDNVNRDRRKATICWQISLYYYISMTEHVHNSLLLYINDRARTQS